MTKYLILVSHDQQSESETVKKQDRYARAVT